jgi:hypothetical protein
MALRGRKPTATHLKLITGNPGKRRLPKGEPEPQGGLVKPARISRRAGELWDEVAAFATWLTVADGYKLHVWCELQAEFERSPRLMVAARLSQLRAAGSELGLDPASRARLGTEKAREDPAASRYF